MPSILNSECTRPARVIRTTLNAHGCDWILGMLSKMRQIFHSMYCLPQVQEHFIRLTVKYDGKKSKYWSLGMDNLKGIQGHAKIAKVLCA